ncbi:autotransporter assembly complex protein TamA [Sphingomonas sp. Ag1]|jgi:translocation and assembly module TamA|uniref:autotransporter assembly complex protein TamA n=1 Tax=Sphingomonas sp. Ag1 TaxID=1642949 RepID=UPI0006214D9E|nr:autotransporter assembly complex family protein [Sphingomonas sp. Ag1]KKI19108.1 outer membrane protein [Sphingomonas sp. Ag1]
MDGRRALIAGAGLIASIVSAPAGAQQAAGTAPAPALPAEQPIDPAAPLADMPDIGVAWPELPPQTPAAQQATAAQTGETRYAWRIDGLDDMASPLLRERFAALSVLDQNDGEAANAAQLDRRAREDSTLLVTLLRAQGYYDAEVEPRIDTVDGRPLVILTATPGPIYRLKEVTIDGVAAAGDKATALRDAFGVKPDDPVDADRITTGEAKLRVEAGEQGFPFAKVGEPEVTIDREARTATLDISVDPGTARVFGQIRANPNNRVFDAEHVQEIARFEPGKPYYAPALDDLRRALVQTGLVSVAEVTPVPGTTPDTVDIDVRLEPAPPRTIAGEIGYGTGEGARVEASWTHRNLFPPEGALTLRSVLGTREQLGAVTFRRNNFKGRDRVLTAQISAAHTNREAYEANTFSLSGSLERQTNIFFQKTWTWSLGAELVASDERDVIVSTGEPRRRTFFIAAAPTSLVYDGSDDLLNPTRGFRLGGRFSPEVSLQGSAFGYARTQVDASAYKSVSDGVVLAGRIRLGTIVGAPRDAIAPSRRFYAGGGASVRGYGYQLIGPRDPNNDPIGGRSLAEFAIEGRIKAFGDFGIVPFFDGGNIYTSALPDFSGLRYGAGVGVRYYSNFGPIRVDVGTPLNPQPGDSRVAVYVSLGQAF